MAVPLWLTTDPEDVKMPARLRPGWAPRPDKKVKLVHGWARPEGDVGAGQAFDAGGYDPQPDLSPFAPPAPPPPASPESPNVTPDVARGDVQPIPTAPVAAPTPQVLTAGPAPATTVVGPAASTALPSGQPAVTGGVFSQPQAPVSGPPAAARAGVVSGAQAAPPPQGPPPASAPPGPKPSTSTVVSSKQGPLQQQFLEANTATAQRIAAETGIPYQVLLAIPGNETGWGLVMKGNNYFGIKGTNPVTGANTGQVGTWEVVNGQRVNTTSTFRAYENYEESARDFVRFLQTNKRYAPALQYLNDNPEDWRGFVRRVHDAGYATDPEWSNKIVRIGNTFEGAPTLPTGTKPLPPDGSGRIGVQAVVDVGQTAIGTKYKWGGAGGRTSFGETMAPTDCSGFVAWAYQRATGIKLTAYTGSIWQQTTGIRADQAAPGDLVMFNMGKGAKMEHVGIYMGNGLMLHDSSLNPNGGVDITPLWDGASFRRVPGVDPSQGNYSPRDAPRTTPAPNDHVIDRSSMAHGGRHIQTVTYASGAQETKDMGPTSFPTGTLIGHQRVVQPAAGGQGLGVAHGLGPGQGLGQGMPLGAGADTLEEGMVQDARTTEALQRQLEDERLERERREAEVQRARIAAEAERMADEERERNAAYEAGQRRRSTNIEAWQGATPQKPVSEQAAEDFVGSAVKGSLGTDLGRGLGRIAAGVPSAVKGAAEAVSGAAQGVASVGEAIGGAAGGALEGARQGVVSALAMPDVHKNVTDENLANTAKAATQAVIDARLPRPDDAVKAVQGAATSAVDLAQRAPEIISHAVETAKEDVKQALPETVDEAVETSIRAAASQPQLAIPAGIANAVNWVRQNGADTTPVEQAMAAPPKPGSVSARVAAGQTITNPADGAALIMEAAEHNAEVRRQAIRALQPPDVRDTPEGWAVREGIVQASDPANYATNVPIFKRGKAILDQSRFAPPKLAADMLQPKTTPKVSKLLDDVLEPLTKEEQIAWDAEQALLTGPRERAAQAAARSAPDRLAVDSAIRVAYDNPMAAREAETVLQRAAVDLNDPLLEQAARDARRAIIGEKGVKYEPLTGEQMRGVIINSVARRNPNLDPRGIVQKTDAILKAAGFDNLTTPALRRAASQTPEEAWNMRRSLAVDERAWRAQQEVRELQRWDSTARYLTDQADTAARQAAVATPNFALALGGGAAGGGLAALQTGDYDDPDRWGTIFGGALTGFLMGIGAPYLGGLIGKGMDKTVLKGLRGQFAPVFNLTQEARTIYQEYVGNYQAAGLAGDILERQMRRIFGDKANVHLLAFMELHDDLPKDVRDLPGAKDFLDDWRRITDWARKYNIIEEPLNLDTGAAKLYIPHVVDKEWTLSLNAAREGVPSGRIPRNPFRYYQQQRQYPTLADGMAANVPYADDAPQILGNYYTRAAQLAANKSFLERMVALSDVNNPRKLKAQAEEMLRGADLVKWEGTWGKPKYGKPLGQIPGFKDVPGVEDIWVSNQYADILENAFGVDEGLARTPIPGFLMDVNSIMKQNLLGGFDLYHVLNEWRQVMATQGPKQGVPTILQSVRAMMNPGFYDDYINQPATRELMKDFVKHGGTLTTNLDRPDDLNVGSQLALMALNTLGPTVGAYGAARATGHSQEEAKQWALAAAALGMGTSAPIFGKGGGLGIGAGQRSLVEHLTRATFDRAVPYMKLTTYSMLRGSEKYGGRVAADFVNDAFGGQNMMALARSRQTQDIMRTLILAPDWTESWARQVGNALFAWGSDAPQGHMARMYWANALFQGFVTLEAMNFALSGHGTWDNEHEGVLMLDASRLYDLFDWDRTDPQTGEKLKIYWDLLGPIRGWLEPMIEIGRGTTVGMYDMLGYDPQTMPFKDQLRGKPGEVPRPDPTGRSIDFVTARMGWLPSTLQELNAGRDFAGRPIDRTQDSEWQHRINRAMLLLNRMVPTGQTEATRAASREDPFLVGAFQTVTGYRGRRVSPTTEHFRWTDDILKRAGSDSQRWRQERDQTIRDNEELDLKIEAIQTGLMNVNNTPVGGGLSDMTARQRNDAIEQLAGTRRSQRQEWFDILADVPEGPGKEELRKEIQDLQARRVVPGGAVPADLNRPDLNVDELVQLAWNREPNEIANLQGRRPAPTDLNEWIDEKLVALEKSPGYDEMKRVSNLRARWTVDTAQRYGIDLALLQDTIKAKLLNINEGTLPPLPGVTSQQLDEFVLEYARRGRNEKGENFLDAGQAAVMRQEYVFQVAQQLGVDPKALTRRIRIRSMPMADASPAAIERSNALEVLQDARYFRYQNPDGSPMGTPKEWDEMDRELANATSVFSYTTIGGVGYFIKNGQLDQKMTDMLRARERGTANKFKDIRKSPHAEAYYRWFGDGADKTDAEWAQYQAGRLDMWRDNPPPHEARNRITAMRVWKELTPEERQTYGLNRPVAWDGTDGAGGFARRRTLLADYISYINTFKTGEWTLGEIDPGPPAPVP